jgi:hypothetical protein
VQLLPSFLKRCFSAIADALFLPQKAMLRPLEASCEQDEVFSVSVEVGLLHLRGISLLLFLERRHTFTSSDLCAY